MAWKTRGVDRDVFAARLSEATARAVELARSYVHDELPAPPVYELRFRVDPPSSCSADETLVPEDARAAATGGPFAATEVVELLWHGGRVPIYVDISVQAAGPTTLVELLVSGKLGSRTTHRADGIAPFHVQGPNLPRDWSAGTKLWLPRRET
jgi:hypothetical protein